MVADMLRVLESPNTHRMLDSLEKLMPKLRAGEKGIFLNIQSCGLGFNVPGFHSVLKLWGCWGGDFRTMIV